MEAVALKGMSRLDRLAVNRLRRRLLAVVVIIGAAGALLGCTQDSSAATAAAVQVNLGRFVIQPSVLEVPAGDVELRVTNVDSDMVHNLVVHGKGTRVLAPGKTQVLPIPDVAAGEYRMWCDVPGHAMAGQVGTLVAKAVTDATTAPS